MGDSLHNVVAAATFDSPRELVCERCGRKIEEVQIWRMAEFLARGWPQCCGLTMTLREPTQRKEE